MITDVNAAVSDKFIEIEKHLKNREFEKADKIFNSFDKKFRLKKVKSNNKEWFVFLGYEDSIKYLQSVYDWNDRLLKIIKDPELGFKKKLPKPSDYNKAYKKISGFPLPFSAGFQRYMYDYYKNLFNLYDQAIALVEAEKEKQAIEAEAERKKRALAMQKENSKRMAAIEAEERKQESDIQKVKRNAKRMGYAGYDGRRITELMKIVQREGGLEKFINVIFFSDPSHPIDRKIKVHQVLEDVCLYSFSHYFSGNFQDFSIYVNNAPGKIYMEKQSLEEGYYVFRKMITYETVIGTQKTIPYFERVDFTEIYNYNKETE